MAAIAEVNPANIINAITGAVNLFTNKNVGSTSNSSSSVQGGDKTVTTSENVSQEGIQTLINQTLGSVNGLAAVAGGQKAAGLYNSSTNSLLINDLLTRTAGQAASLNKTSTQSTVNTSPTVTTGSTGQQQVTKAPVNPLGLAGGLALWNAVPQAGKDVVKGLFGVGEKPAAGGAANAGKIDSKLLGEDGSLNDAVQASIGVGTGSAASSSFDALSGAPGAGAISSFTPDSFTSLDNFNFADNAGSIASAIGNVAGGAGDAANVIGSLGDAASYAGDASDLAFTGSDAADQILNQGADSGGFFSDVFSSIGSWFGFANGGMVKGYADGGSVSDDSSGTLASAMNIRKRTSSSKASSTADGQANEQDKANEKLRLDYIKQSQREALDSYKLISKGISEGASPGVIGEILSKLNPSAQAGVKAITDLFKPIQPAGVPNATLRREAVAREQTDNAYADGGRVRDEDLLDGTSGTNGASANANANPDGLSPQAAAAVDAAIGAIGMGLTGIAGAAVAPGLMGLASIMGMNPTPTAAQVANAAATAVGIGGSNASQAANDAAAAVSADTSDATQAGTNTDAPGLGTDSDADSDGGGGVGVGSSAGGDGGNGGGGDGSSAGAAGSSADGSYAHGGYVAGPGNGISDSIAARLSDGEYVIPADVVEALGPKHFDDLLAKYHTPASKQRMARAA